jgi:hypothetical protein
MANAEGQGFSPFGDGREFESPRSLSCTEPGF